MKNDDCNEEENGEEEMEQGKKERDWRMRRINR